MISSVVEEGFGKRIGSRYPSFQESDEELEVLKRERESTIA